MVPSMAIRLVAGGLVAAASSIAAQPSCLPRVLSATGTPIAGAQVEVFVLAAGPSLLLAPREALAAGTTTADGGLDLRLPAVSRLAVIVDAPGHPPVIAELDGLAQRCPEWRLPTAGAALRLLVEEETGEPVAGVRTCVRWQGGDEVLGWPRSFERCADSARDGRVEVVGLAATTAGEVSFEAKDFLPLRRALPLAGSRRIRLERGRLLVGKVVGPGSHPVAGAQLATSEGARAESDAAGAFALRVAAGPPASAVASPAPPTALEAGWFAVAAPGFRQRFVRVTEQAEPLLVRLEPGPTLGATLLAASGEPLPAATVRLQREVAEGKWIADWRRPTLTAGRFLVDLPAAGRYRAQIRAEGHRVLDLPLFEAGPATPVELGPLALSLGVTVAGRVVDAASGRPVSGVLVRLLPQGLVGVRRLAEVAPAQSVSEGDGSFLLVGQAGGAHELRIEHDGYARIARELVLVEGERAETGDLALSAGCRVTGLVLDRAGRPRPGLVVRWSTGGTESLEPIAERSTDESGRFEPVALGPGSYRLELHADRLLLSQELAIEAGEVERDLELVADGTRLAGQVVRRGEPVGGGMLVASQVQDPGQRSGKLLVRGGATREVHGAVARSYVAPVDELGRFELADVPSGALQVVYVGVEGEEISRTLEVPAQAEAWATVELAGLALEGVVRDGDLAVADAEIELRDPAGNRVGVARSGADGRFRVPDLPGGPVLLEASSPGYARRTVSALDPSRVVGPVLVELEPADRSALSVELRTAGGGPLAYAVVSLFRAGGGLERSLALDALGEKRFEGLEAGAYYLVWSDPAVGVGASPVLELAGGEERRWARQLEPPTLVLLECREERCAQASLTGLSVRTAEGIELAAHLPAGSLGAAFNADGTLPLGLLAPGGYRLVARAGGGLWQVPLTVASGAALPLRVPLAEQRAAAR